VARGWHGGWRSLPAARRLPEAHALDLYLIKLGETIEHAPDRAIAAETRDLRLRLHRTAGGMQEIGARPRRTAHSPQSKSKNCNAPSSTFSSSAHGSITITPCKKTTSITTACPACQSAIHGRSYHAAAQRHHLMSSAGTDGQMDHVKENKMKTAIAVIALTLITVSQANATASRTFK
jgi:hypothetical protein